MKQHTSQSIAVLGAGSWGTALAWVLANNNQSVRLWGRSVELVSAINHTRENTRYLPGVVLPSNITVTDNLCDAVDGVADVLLAIPSHIFMRVLADAKPSLHPGVRFISATKGVDPSGKLLTDCIADLFSKETPVALMSGPSFATEVAAGKPTAVCLSGNAPDFLQDVIVRFHSKTFRVYQREDVIGPQVCGVVKNVLAIAAGMSEGMQLGANAMSAMVTRGLVEMQRLNAAMGGLSQTVMGLPGLGDLVLTCTGGLSRNRRFGMALGEGLSIAAAKDRVGQVVEGADNAVHVLNLARLHQVDMPMCEAVYRVIMGEWLPKDALNALLERPPNWA